MLAPLLATLTLVPDGDLLTTASDARGLLVGTATLAAGVFMYLHWRITANETTAGSPCCSRSRPCRHWPWAPSR